MPVTSYSRTPASNNAAPPNGWPEGQTPGSVNNSARQLMTDIVNEAAKGQARVLGSVAGTNTITAGMSPALDAYTAGMVVVFTPANSNTGATTLNIDALGALDILNFQGLPVAAGELAIGIPALLLLDSGADDFILINPVGIGSFTGTLTGFASGPTGTVSYKINNGMCTLYTGAEISGTSNAVSMSMTGLPTAVRPSGAREVASAAFVNNTLTNSYLGGASISTSGVVTFKLLNFSNGLLGPSEFVASGSKGLSANWAITYPL